MLNDFDEIKKKIEAEENPELEPTEEEMRNKRLQEKKNREVVIYF